MSKPIGQKLSNLVKSLIDYNEINPVVSQETSGDTTRASEYQKLNFDYHASQKHIPKNINIHHILCDPALLKGKVELAKGQKLKDFTIDGLWECRDLSYFNEQGASDPKGIFDEKNRPESPFKTMVPVNLEDQKIEHGDLKIEVRSLLKLEKELGPGIRFIQDHLCKGFFAGPDLFSKEYVRCNNPKLSEAFPEAGPSEIRLLSRVFDFYIAMTNRAVRDDLAQCMTFDFLKPEQETEENLEKFFEAVSVFYKFAIENKNEKGLMFQRSTGDSAHSKPYSRPEIYAVLRLHVDSRSKKLEGQIKVLLEYFAGEDVCSNMIGPLIVYTHDVLRCKLDQIQGKINPEKNNFSTVRYKREIEEAFLAIADRNLAISREILAACYTMCVVINALASTTLKPVTRFSNTAFFEKIMGDLLTEAVRQEALSKPGKPPLASGVSPWARASIPAGTQSLVLALTRKSLLAPSSAPIAIPTPNLTSTWTPTLQSSGASLESSVSSSPEALLASSPLSLSKNSL
ncbi:hypothetical protein [Paraburkholderia bonniea]|uniref:hypothetical protein n=1 Tax=Paraburkholderia bonniea TaxID=2152891 RepID=UPI001290C733|nr:hypothetical protein [Paraburkholderia bonniea]